MHITLALDNKMAKLWYPLRPKFNIFQMDTPDKISGNIKMPKPNVASHSSWIEE